jgi:hypothetical protein
MIQLLSNTLYNENTDNTSISTVISNVYKFKGVVFDLKKSNDLQLKKYFIICLLEPKLISFLKISIEHGLDFLLLVGQFLFILILESL